MCIAVCSKHHCLTKHVRANSAGVKFDVSICWLTLQYVKSKNCMMEFRFAAVQLNVPIILAVFGTGYEWEKSEVGVCAR